MGKAFSGYLLRSLSNRSPRQNLVGNRFQLLGQNNAPPLARLAARRDKSTLRRVMLCLVYQNSVVDSLCAALLQIFAYNL